MIADIPVLDLSSITCEFISETGVVVHNFAPTGEKCISTSAFTKFAQSKLQQHAISVEVETMPLGMPPFAPVDYSTQYQFDVELEDATTAINCPSPMCSAPSYNDQISVGPLSVSRAYMPFSNNKRVYDFPSQSAGTTLPSETISITHRAKAVVTIPAARLALVGAPGIGGEEKIVVTRSYSPEGYYNVGGSSRDYSQGTFHWKGTYVLRSSGRLELTAPSTVEFGAVMVGGSVVSRELPVSISASGAGLVGLSYVADLAGEPYRGSIGGGSFSVVPQGGGEALDLSGREYFLPVPAGLTSMPLNVNLLAPKSAITGSHSANLTIRARYF